MWSYLPYNNSTPRHGERERGNPGFIAARLEPWHEISRLLHISSGDLKTWVATLALAMTGETLQIRF